MRTFTNPSILLMFAQFHAALSSFNRTITLGGCQNVDASRNHCLYLIEPSELHLPLSIVTTWHYYSQDLRIIIPPAGFKLVSEPTQMMFAKACDWKYLFGVSKNRIYRGYVSFKDLNSTVNGETIQRARDILLDHAPTRDIIELVVIIAGPIVASALLLALIYALSLWFFPEDHSFDEEIQILDFKVTRSTVITPLDSLHYPESIKEKHSAWKDQESGVIQTYDASSIKAGESYPAAYCPFLIVR